MIAIIQNGKFNTALNITGYQLYDNSMVVHPPDFSPDAPLVPGDPGEIRLYGKDPTTPIRIVKIDKINVPDRITIDILSDSGKLLIRFEWVAPGMGVNQFRVITTRGYRLNEQS